MTHNTKPIQLTRLRPSPEGDEPTCLFVGDEVSVQRASRILPDGLNMDHCHIYDLVRQLRDPPMPGMVLSFAITPLFDCLDLAQILRLNGFSGRLRIIDRDLPAPLMICREVRLACPGLNFSVLDMAELRWV